MNWLWLRLFLLTILTFILLIPLLAIAQASQPASAPATAAWILWLKAHWAWLLLAVVLPCVITGLSKFPSPTTNKIIAILQMIIDIFSFTTHKDSPNTFKMIFTRSKPPGWTKAAKKEA
jgi:hypothetical protein